VKRTYDSIDDVRHAQLYRLFLTARTLASAWLTLYTLADRLHCSPRTARRYVYVLQRAGADVRSRRPRTGHAIEYRLDRQSWLALLDLPDDHHPRETCMR
jgi:hypothetical protein